MFSRDYVDVATGAVLALIGIGAALYCATHYDLGQLNYMGPGMFPAGAGLCLAIFGAFIAVPALLRAGPAPEINLRAALAVLASIGVFAATATRLGLVPATLLTIVVAALGDTKLGIIGTLVLAGSLSLLAWVIFVLALGITLPAFRWPL